MDETWKRVQKPQRTSNCGLGTAGWDMESRIEGRRIRRNDSPCMWEQFFGRE